MEPEPQAPTDRVTVPRWALVALVVTVLVSLLAAAFLLGRESARSGQAPGGGGSTASPPVRERPEGLTLGQVSEPRLAVTPVPSLPTGTPLTPSARDGNPSAASPPRRPTADGGLPESPPRVAEPAPLPVDPAKAREVAHYFQALEAAVGVAAAWQDPDALAHTVLNQGAEGNSSGFDMVEQASSQALARVRALAPPESCRRHHQLTMHLMESGLSLLRRLRTATLSGEASALADLAAEGQTLQAQVQNLDLEGRQIRARFGL